MKGLKDHLAEQALERYILAHIDPEPEHLRHLRREAHIRLVQPRMISGHLQGRLLALLVSLVRPRHVLEIGTYTAYATACLAENLAPESRLTTIEIEEELEEFIRHALESSPRTAQIDLLIGDALCVLPSLDLSQTDLVYLDADKRLYPQLFQLIEHRLPSGALVLADNTLWSGKVCAPEATDKQTEGIRAFNDYAACLEGWQKVILPIRDGLTLLRKH